MEITITGSSIYLKGDEPLVSGDEVLSKIVEGDRLFVKHTNIEGLFTYGCEQLVDGYMGHKAGYIWSSRAGCINKVFDCATIECNYTTNGYSYTTCAIDLAHLIPMLEETDYEVDMDPFVDESDIRYSIRKKVHR